SLSGSGSARSELETEADAGAVTPLDEGGFANFFFAEVECGDKTKTIQVGFSLQALGKALDKLTGGWPKSANGLLFAEKADSRPLWMKAASELFAWIGAKIPPVTQNKLEWAGGADKATEAQFHSFVLQ